MFAGAEIRKGKEEKTHYIDGATHAGSKQHKDITDTDREEIRKGKAEQKPASCSPERRSGKA